MSDKPYIFRQTMQNNWGAAFSRAFTEDAVTALSTHEEVAEYFWYDEIAGIQKETFDALELRIKGEN